MWLPNDASLYVLKLVLNRAAKGKLYMENIMQRDGEASGSIQVATIQRHHHSQTLDHVS